MLVGASEAVGWCVGVIRSRNPLTPSGNAVVRGGAKCNFLIYYDIDGKEVPTALGLDEYDGDGENQGWVLLEEMAGAADAFAPPAAGAGCGSSR